MAAGGSAVGEFGALVEELGTRGGELGQGLGGRRAEHGDAVTVLEGEPDTEVAFGSSSHGVTGHQAQQLATGGLVRRRDLVVGMLGQLT